jgi:hypothetical protein
MLNLATVFSDALVALDEHAEFLMTRPLPATIFLMQRDVINHYRYALTHYFDLTLDEAFLQNSSHGPPYSKWAKFTNSDFEMFSFAFHNLLRYTSRFIHETQCAALTKSERFHERAIQSNKFTFPICDMRHKNIGIRIEENRVLAITPFATGPHFVGRCTTRYEGTEIIHEHTITDSDGTEHATILTQDEYRKLVEVLKEQRYDISDRKVISTLKNDGLAEVAVLSDQIRAFGDLVNCYYAEMDVATGFEAMNESWWV